VGSGLSKAELEALSCWESEDQVPGRPEMTEFRRALRGRQARWREAKGYPIGSQPIAPKQGQKARPVGNRLAFDFAKESGANFVTAGALEAARARAGVPEPHQRFDHQRLWAELLWSPTLAFNLFGELAADRSLADRAIRAWWPDAPGSVAEVRFAHSPGRFDWSYLGSLRSFDAAFVLDLGDGTQGIIAVDVQYHDYAKAHIAKPIGRPRQREVAERAAIFVPGAVDAADQTGMLVTSLEHLLLLSMLQHESGHWSWGRYVVVYPAGNSDFADVCTTYGDLLTDRSTFASATIEELLGAGALPPTAVEDLRERYVAP
jgi:hypothetical protein